MSRAISDARDSRISGVTTGLATLDEALCGLAGGRVYVICAMSGVGKTMLAESIASHNAARGIGVVYALVADMNPVELADRQLAREASIDSRRIARARTTPTLTSEEWARISPAMATLAKWPFAAIKARGATVDDVIARARFFADTGIETRLRDDLARAPLGLLVVDYVQRLSAPSELANRKKYEVLDHAAERLKRTAEDLDVPVIVIAQAKNLTDGRTGKPIKPTPGAMVCADSSGIDREADCVIYVHADKSKTPRRRDLLVLKGRGGGEIEIALDFDGPHCRFTEAAPTSPHGNAWHSNDGDD